MDISWYSKLDIQNKTNEEKNIRKIILLSSTVIITLVSFTIAYMLIKLQLKEFKTHLDTFKNTLIQREKFTIKSNIENLKEDIAYEKKANKARIKQSIENQTKIAVKLARLIYLENKKLPKKEIIQKIKKAIQNISIKKEGVNYFIFDGSGTFLLNTKYKKYEGENFLDFKDLNDKEFVKEIIEKSKTKNSFVDFLWYKPDSSKAERKIVYAKYIKDLDIVISSGRYIGTNEFSERYITNKLKKRKLSDDDFILMYKIGSLSDIKRYSKLILARNIKVSKNTLNLVQKILLSSNYGGDIFFETKDKLMYGVFFRSLRIFLAYGMDLKRLNEIINAETKLSNENLQEKIISLVLSISAITLIFFIFSYFISTKIETIFKDYRQKVINNERKYQLLFNHSNDGFIISKITDSKKAIIISTNMIAKKISGYGMNILGKNFFDLLEEFDTKSLLKHTESLGKAILIAKDGSKKTIELSCVVYRHDEEILLFASLRDISERINLKIEKNRQEKLLIQKSKMASMGEMIGNIAHQWRQPISELSGLFFDIESAYDYGELDKKYLSKRTDEANDLLEYLSKTIDDFKEFYNPNSKRENFYLLKSIKKALSIIHSSFKYHNIKVHVDVDKDIVLYGYSNEFSQVLLNILSNAKEIALIREVKKPNIKIYVKRQKNKTMLFIEDNCGGIEEENAEKIFEPYFTTKYDYGTGIGLYMSKIIIENKMEGKIYAENFKSKGARFVIVI